MTADIIGPAITILPKGSSDVTKSTNTWESVEHPVTLSLFSGGGGLDIGFHKAGFRIVACVEIDKAACDTLRLNVGSYLDPECNILNRDVRELQPAEITQSKVDFIIGGPPCQSFSAIGRRAGGVEGIEDQRGSLFEHYCRLVEHFQPRGFLFENVRGILGANSGKDWVLIKDAFAGLGYQLSYRVLDCADYGVPQHRERLIMVGTRYGSVLFPRPTHGPDSTGHRPYVGAMDAIADLQDPEEPYHTYNGKYGHLLSEVPPGQNYHFFTREMGYSNPIFAWRSRFSDFLYKADPDRPVRTIVAKLGAYSGPFHWKNRRFTLAEFKRLQSFPDDYRFPDGLGAALKQIGNSVPPKFAEQLARAIKQQLFGVGMGVELIEQADKLSFDSRKSKKAKSTRSKRASNGNGQYYAGLFDWGSSQTRNTHVRQHTKHLLDYASPRLRKHVQGDRGATFGGNLFEVEAHRDGETCALNVSRCNPEEPYKPHSSPLLRYSVRFHHEVGNGLREVHCTLFSNTGEDIPVAWDVVEDYLGSCSGYRTMMDVYGHFTEPHPAFSLEMEILDSSPDFPVRFAKAFSTVEACSSVLPSAELYNLMGNDRGKWRTFADAVRWLRALRFDVRVNETNPTIPKGYFRCCYPFTININKQISVTWRDTQGVISW